MKLLCKLVSLFSCAALLSGCIVADAASPAFSDVPEDSWAESYIETAVDLGVIGGYGNNVFGYGDPVSRAQFAAMLVRLFGWEPVIPIKASFADCGTSQWYYDEIETAVAHGAVVTDSKTFRPDEPITRAEMAVMLVRALGYDTLAQTLPASDLPFTDVTENTAYIAIARDFGIINGMTPTSFAPGSSATREQAAAMMIRLYTAHSSKTDFLHAFYAISSYAQRGAIPTLDAVSLGWGRLQYSVSGGVALNQTSSDGNVYSIPAGYQEITGLAEQFKVPSNLSVCLYTSQRVTLPDGTVSNACREILTSPQNRSAAVDQIVKAVTGAITYSGVTIDFEGMKGEALKAGLNSFLQELRARLTPLGLSLYVCVPPVTADGYYFDAYDYRTIGELADRVILMAHDYEASTLTASLMAAGFTATPLTPFPSVYWALRAITDPETGVQDHGKIALALSFGSVQWTLAGGSVQNAAAMTPAAGAIYNRLTDPAATLHYSQTYRNPYLTYSSGGIDNVVWYEDERSVADKIELARMFGITGVSVWRLGLVPDYGDPADRAIYYDVMRLLTERK